MDASSDEDEDLLKPAAKAVDQEGEAVFPGDRITFGPAAPALVVLGVGVLREEGSLIATKAGVLRFDALGGRLWVEGEQRRYVPAVEDHVVGVVVEKLSEEYRVELGGASTAALPVLAFDGATRRNRPNLQVGSLVFARVVMAHRDMEPELSCAAPPGVASKDWMTGQSLFGELKGGTIVAVTLGGARSLAADEGAGGALLAAIGESIPFEVAVGANGRAWINATTVVDMIVIRTSILAGLAAPAAEHAAIVQAAAKQRARLM
jgi:exosome complex component RRP40